MKGRLLSTAACSCSQSGAGVRRHHGGVCGHVACQCGGLGRADRARTGARTVAGERCAVGVAQSRRPQCGSQRRWYRDMGRHGHGHSWTSARSLRKVRFVGPLIMDQMLTVLLSLLEACTEVSSKYRYSCNWATHCTLVMPDRAVTCKVKVDISLYLYRALSCTATGGYRVYSCTNREQYE